MTVNPRETLDRQLHRLFDEILFMGSMVENATLDAVEALKQGDLTKAQQVYDGDKEINNKRFEIEKEVMVIISTQQPMARDARILSSIFEVANELERIGDYAKGIGKICLLMADHPPVKPLIDIPRMANTAVKMLSKALNAFTTFNSQLAREIPKEDNLVDDLYNQVMRELVTYMIADPSVISRANYLMWAAHNLERMADRVTNICERTIYVVTGQMEEIKPSDDEQELEEINSGTPES